MVFDNVPDLLLGAAILWLLNAVALFPVLVSNAVKRLVRAWPTDSLILNYLADVTVFTAVHVVWLLVPLILQGGQLQGHELAWLAGTTLLNLVLWWVAVAIAFPALGVWSPKEGEEYDGRIALTLELFVYALATGFTALAVVVIAIAVAFPG